MGLKSQSKTYTTISGDAWDTIAKKVYGDETKIGLLMAANFPLLDIFIFPAGTVLQVPELPEEEQAEELPIWRR